MNIYNHRTGLNRLLISAAMGAAILLPASCGGKEEHKEMPPEETITENRIYDHLDKIINQYCNLLMSTPVDGMEMEALLMDINSRCQMLAAEGDTLKALYFHHAIEQNVRKRDSVLADRIFGQCPYTAFAIERE